MIRGVALAVLIVVTVLLPVTALNHEEQSSDPNISQPIETTTPSLIERAPAIQSESVTSNDSYVQKQDEAEAFRLPEIAESSEVVAVLDTGIDRNHEELDGEVIDQVNFTTSSVPSDRYGHGTHVAGIIGGLALKCPLLNVKVADDAGRCQASALAEGIVWAVNNGAKVINISIEIREPSSELEEAVNYAWSQGAIIIAAAGNEGNQLPIYPAYYENCIAVAAIKQDGTLATLSNYGDWVDVAAPGFKVYSCLPENNYGYKTGTSFACAYVSGIAALLFDVVSDTNGDGRLNDDVRAALEAGLNFKQGGGG